MKNLGDDFTEEDIDDMIADVDTDGSGWVDYDGKHGDVTSHANFLSSVLLVLSVISHVHSRRYM